MYYAIASPMNEFETTYHDINPNVSHHGYYRIGMLRNVHKSTSADVKMTVYNVLYEYGPIP